MPIIESKQIICKEVTQIELTDSCIEKLAEALNKQKTGKWIKDEEQSREHTEPIFICSCCQNNSAWGTEERTRYCSFCGARMVGKEE